MDNLVKETKANYNLGEYAITGGPGRPKGSKNKFTLIKEQMAEVWHEEMGKERFRALFTKDERTFIRALKEIIAILPKEIDLGKDENGNAAKFIIQLNQVISGKHLESAPRPARVIGSESSV